MKVNFKSGLIFSSLLSTMFMLTACQEKPAPQAEQKAVQSQSEVMPLIQAKIERVEIPKKQFCDEGGCIQYDLQTVKSNVAWIDDYFMTRIKKDVPNAFEQGHANAQTEHEAQQSALKGLSQNSIYVRFISQQNNLATFVIQTYSYAAGAAHGMYHNEYVTFDLNTKKRLALTDILKPNVEAKVAEQLYDANANWLIQKDITREKLQLSDNYYYGVNGIVFVYPLYELTSYADGMPELKLPYQVAKDLVKAEYLPSLPQVEPVVEKPVSP